MQHQEIAACFNRLFGREYNTAMFGGAAEPLYLPAGPYSPAQLFYREDHAASALHEAAHWCIAGSRRRRLEDFGYAYLPPPRDACVQQRFFALELRTQTLEKLFAQAAGLPFRPSADNLQASVAQFALQIEAFQPQLQRWLTASRDGRARRLLDALGRASNRASEMQHGTR